MGDGTEAERRYARLDLMGRLNTLDLNEPGKDETDVQRAQRARTSILRLGEMLGVEAPTPDKVMEAIRNTSMSEDTFKQVFAKIDPGALTSGNKESVDQWFKALNSVGVMSAIQTAAAERGVDMFTINDERTGKQVLAYGKATEAEMEADTAQLFINRLKEGNFQGLDTISRQREAAGKADAFKANKLTAREYVEALDKGGKWDDLKAQIKDAGAGTAEGKALQAQLIREQRKALASHQFLKKDTAREYFLTSSQDPEVQALLDERNALAAFGGGSGRATTQRLREIDRELDQYAKPYDMFAYNRGYTPGQRAKREAVTALSGWMQTVNWMTSLPDDKQKGGLELLMKNLDSWKSRASVREKEELAEGLRIQFEETKDPAAQAMLNAMSKHVLGHGVLEGDGAVYEDGDKDATQGGGTGDDGKGESPIDLNMVISVLNGGQLVYDTDTGNYRLQFG